MAWLLSAGWQYESATFWLLVVAMPFQAISVATLWLGESKRADRAGRYMAAIEADFNALLNITNKYPERGVEGVRRPYPGLGWESYLRRHRGRRYAFWKTAQLQLPYFALAGYLFMMAIAPAIAAWYLAHLKWSQNHPAPIFVGSLVCLIFGLLFGWFLYEGKSD